MDSGNTIIGILTVFWFVRIVGTTGVFGGEEVNGPHAQWDSKAADASTDQTDRIRVHKRVFGRHDVDRTPSKKNNSTHN